MGSIMFHRCPYNFQKDIVIEIKKNKKNRKHKKEIDGKKSSVVVVVIDVARQMVTLTVMVTVMVTVTVTVMVMVVLMLKSGGPNQVQIRPVGRSSISHAQNFYGQIPNHC